MGKYDDAMYRYLSDNDRFADLFNAVLFAGEKVLRGELLEPDSERHVEALPRDVLPKVALRNAPKASDTRSRFRDIKKRAKTGEVFVVTAIENQEVIDYTMPWRIMQYDQMAYGEQIRNLRRQKAAALREQGKTPSDWTTRLRLGDRICPVYTICFYHGTESWDGPRSLKDMMRFEGMLGAEGWRQCFHDYGMTLFCVNETGDLSRFGTELRQLLEVLAVRKDKQRLAELWRREDFVRLDRETAETMAIMTDSTEILEKLGNYETEGGYNNMCLAMDELRQDWKAEGRAEGRAEELENGIACLVKAIKQLGADMEAAVQQLVVQYGLDETTATGKAKLYW